jgi:hypothetical protein
LHVRAGEFAMAVPQVQRSLTVNGRPGNAVLNWLWLALAYRQMGEAEEARRWLEKAAAWLDQQGDRMPLQRRILGLHPHDWLEAHVLRREAEALIRRDVRDVRNQSVTRFPPRSGGGSGVVCGAVSGGVMNWRLSARVAHNCSHTLPRKCGSLERWRLGAFGRCLEIAARRGASVLNEQMADCETGGGAWTGAICGYLQNFST